jgi:tRNA-Thr(GGU) m(6)t(6)A37 methyltransferase TsaA
MVQDDGWDSEQCYVELDPNLFSSNAFDGITDFSHVEILFFMDRVDPQKIELGSRHPRNNTNWPKVGVFSQRVKNRPNQIGSTVCRILRVEGTRIHLLGLDAVDGSPVLDIKPWLNGFGPRGIVFEPQWTRELMEKYW